MLRYGIWCNRVSYRPYVIIFGASRANSFRIGFIANTTTGTIQVDGKTVATGRIERTLAFRLSLDETLDCGEDTGTPVCEDYHVPFKFTGDLKQVVIDLKPEPLSADDDAKLKAGKAAIHASE